MTTPAPTWLRSYFTIAAALSGAFCCLTTPAVIPTPSTASATPHDFTVATTEKVKALDPVAVTDSMSTTMVSALFQRLLTLDEGKTALHPDAAAECIFVSALQYRCTLKANLKFTNG